MLKCSPDSEVLCMREMAVFLFNLKCQFSFSGEQVQCHRRSHRLNHPLPAAQWQVSGPKHPGPRARASDSMCTFHLCSLQRRFSGSERKSFIVGVFPPLDSAESCRLTHLSHVIYERLESHLKWFCWPQESFRMFPSLILFVISMPHTNFAYWSGYILQMSAVK